MTVTDAQRCYEEAYTKKHRVLHRSIALKLILMLSNCCCLYVITVHLIFSA